ncbi:MAG: lipopolysaccharide biosynthesis protein [Proteobacteria bacterium]|nr:lipopolysaccharide biosynthesis protein [Pseudomonadota bacterium]
MTSLRRSMAKGVAWMVLFKALDRGLGLVSTLILARILVPKDFGLVAMATSLIALLELFTAFGLDTVLIQRASATRSHYNTAWTLNILAGTGIATLMLLSAWPASVFYHEPRVIPVICTLAAGAFLQGFENVGVVDFRKQMRFDLEFRYLLARRIIMFVITIPLALWLRNYWALVAGIVGGRCAGLVLSFLLQPYRPRLSLAAAADLLNFSKWLVVQNLLSFLKTRSSDFIVGRFAGPHALGIFSVSFEVSNMPSTELVAPINRALLPAYSKLAGDPAALRAEYLSVMSVIALLVVPVVAGFAVAAPFLVLLALGGKWLDATPVLQILAFYGITNVMVSNSYAAFLALGKPQTFARIDMLHVAVLVPTLIALTSLHADIGAAWAYVLAAVLTLPLTLYFITRFLGLRYRDFLRQLWRPLVAAAIMYLVVRALGPASPTRVLGVGEAALSLGQCVAMGAVVYSLAILVLWTAAGRPLGAETLVLGQVRERWHKLRTA